MSDDDHDDGDDGNDTQDFPPYCLFAYPPSFIDKSAQSVVAREVYQVDITTTTVTIIKARRIGGRVGMCGGGKV